MEELALGCPFCLTGMEDTLKARSMEAKTRVRDLSEMIARCARALESN